MFFMLANILVSSNVLVKYLYFFIVITLLLELDIIFCVVIIKKYSKKIKYGGLIMITLEIALILHYYNIPVLKMVPAPTIAQQHQLWKQ